MEFAIPGFVKRFCTPNAMLTVSEYIYDYSSPETIEAINAQLAIEMEQMEEGKIKEELKEKLIRVANGERDLYF